MEFSRIYDSIPYILEDSRHVPSACWLSPSLAIPIVSS
jgi:hypothetical protein